MFNLQTLVNEFVGGKLKYFSSTWEKYTSDKFIINTIRQGLKLEFVEFPQQNQCKTHPLSKTETKTLQKEVSKLLQKGVIGKTTKTTDDFISGVFTRDKKDGTKRMILNLKRFNTHIQYKHFKMESIQNVINVIRPGDYMASIDLKDAFFSVPIYKPHKKYLKFFLGEFYKFTLMPNGFGPAMREFTKISKVPFSVLRNRGHISYICCFCG